MKGNLENNEFGLKINMIGESMYLLNIYLTRNIFTKTNSVDKKQKNLIFDFWDFDYKFNSPIQEQIKYVFRKYEENKSNFEINSKEALIVHVSNKNSELIETIFLKMEELKSPHYMPLVLFLLDENNENEDNNKIIPDKKIYPNIDPSTIYTASYIFDKEYIFESEQNFLSLQAESKIEKIINILLRFCSYHNDLGDRFSIGKGKNQINFDLTEKYFPFTINLCCIGRFGKGKSTCVNCVLGETKSKESSSGTSTTKKIKYYQIKNQPIKIYDIPGFENKETTLNAVKKLKELQDEINELKEQIHVILYIIKSNDERMFADLEYDMLKEVSIQKKSKLLYVLTHSSSNTDKEEVIDMINIGIKGVLEKHKNENNDIFENMKATEQNCVFVNFKQKDNSPIYGIDELFLKISILVKLTESYHKFKEYTDLSEEEYKKRIKEEAELRKKKAEKVMLYHSISAGAVGCIPGADITLQKFVIQKSATKKIGQIFGIDIDLIFQNNENQNTNEENNQDSSSKNGKKFGNKVLAYAPTISTNIAGSGATIGNIILNYGPKAGQVSTEIACTALRGVSISLFFIGSAVGIGLGYFFMHRHCKELINNLYDFFVDNIKTLSFSYEQAVKYLDSRFIYYNKLRNNS